MLLQKPGGSIGGGGGGSSLNTVTGTVDFGTTETSIASVTISAAWVTTGSIIVAQAISNTADHPDPEEALLEELHSTVGNIVDGVSFDVFVFAPNGATGEYTVACIEV